MTEFALVVHLVNHHVRDLLGHQQGRLDTLVRQGEVDETVAGLLAALFINVVLRDDDVVDVPEAIKQKPKGFFVNDLLYLMGFTLLRLMHFISSSVNYKVVETS